MAKFDMYINRRGTTNHPRLVFSNPSQAMIQILDLLVNKGPFGPHNQRANNKAGARYDYIKGAHGAVAHIDLMNGEYGEFLDLLKRWTHYLDGEGNPRELVVSYGDSSKAEEDCMEITTYLEGSYFHNREDRSITFYPKDGDDVVYVVGTVNQHNELHHIRRKEVVVAGVDMAPFVASGVFEQVSNLSAVPHIVNTNPDVGGIRYLCLTDDQYQCVTEELANYKIAFILDNFK